MTLQAELLEQLKANLSAVGIATALQNFATLLPVFQEYYDGQFTAEQTIARIRDKVLRILLIWYVSV